MCYEGPYAFKEECGAPSPCFPTLNIEKGMYAFKEECNASFLCFPIKGGGAHFLVFTILGGDTLALP